MENLLKSSAHAGLFCWALIVIATCMIRCLLAFFFVQIAFAEVPRRVSRQGDLFVEQIVSPGFEQLAPKRKLFAYYLSRAMRMSKDIHWHQASRTGYRIREFLSDLWVYSESFSASDKAALSEYFFRILMEHRNYDRFSNSKFIPDAMSKDTYYRMAMAAAETAERAGVGDAKNRIIQEALYLEKEIFDKDFRPILLADPREGDAVANSNSAFYGSGVTMAHIDELATRGLLSSLAHVEVMEGAPAVRNPSMQGLFDKYLRAADFYLSKARAFATPGETKFIDALRTAFDSGLETDWKRAFAAWLENRPTDLDFMIGFIEKYEDPLGERRAWESWIVVLAKDPGTVERVERTRAHAPDFERINPYDDEFKLRGDFVPPHSEGNEMLYAAGRTGEQPFMGKNLFEDPELKELYGNKSFTNLNLLADKSGEALNSEKPFYAPRYRALLDKVDLNLYKRVHVEFHEILGHGSSRARHGVTGEALNELYSPLEEARAEVASLYHMMGDEAHAFGILKFQDAKGKKAFQRIALLMFFTDHIISFQRLSETTSELRQAHQWGRHLILNYLIEQGCLSIPADGGLPQLLMKSISACRTHLGNLWQKIQFARSTGNYQVAAELFERYGKIEPYQLDWREQVTNEINRQQRPKHKAVINPLLKFDETTNSVTIAYRSASKNGIAEFIDEQVTENAEIRAEIDRASSCPKRLVPEP